MTGKPEHEAGEQWQSYLVACADCLKFVQQHIPLVRRVLDRLSDLLPPQVDEDELVAHLVYELLQMASGEADASSLEPHLWQAALTYLRGHPVVKAAAKWLGRDLYTTSDENVLREVALVLTVFADRWLPTESEADQGLLAEAMSRLASYERLALALYFYDGLTLPEIAEVLDIPPDEAAGLYASALRQLRTNLAELSAADIAAAA